MANKKFYYGDTVMLRHERYPRHHQHRGRVQGFKVSKSPSPTKPNLVYYKVACECGAHLLPLSAHLVPVSTPLDGEHISLLDSRRMFFLKQIGMQIDQGILREQVGSALGVLNEQQKAVVSQRFGLYTEGGSTLRAIAENLGYTKQYIMKVQRKAMQKLEAFPGLVKGHA